VDSWILVYAGQTFGPLTTSDVRDLCARSPLPRDATATKVGQPGTHPLYAWPEFSDLAPPPVAAQMPTPMPVTYVHAPQQGGGMFGLTWNCLGCIVALFAVSVVALILVLIVGGVSR
jgi:hypothetical protein